LERAIRIMDVLAHTPGASIRDLTGRLGIPRSTVYRLINTLTVNGLVVPEGDQGFALGPRLVQLARGVRQGADLVATVRPVMDDLARALSCSVKLSVLDDETALVVAVSQGPQTYSVSTQVGRRFPLHAGAASKVLAAWQDPEARAWLSRPLAKLTEQTITDPAILTRHLADVRRSGYARDQGEYARGVNAIAYPVMASEGQCVASLSIPYLVGLDPDTEESYRAGLERAARHCSRLLGGQVP
jgi:DNA-binding IclR family transcriptional regulator